MNTPRLSNVLVAAAISAEACSSARITQENLPHPTEAVSPTRYHKINGQNRGADYYWEYNCNEFGRYLCKRKWNATEPVDKFAINDLVAEISMDLRKRTEVCVRGKNMPPDFRWKALRRCDRELSSPTPYMNGLWKIGIPEDIAMRIVHDSMVLNPFKQQEDDWDDNE